jgi:hypothetical protein
MSVPKAKTAPAAADQSNSMKMNRYQTVPTSVRRAGPSTSQYRQRTGHLAYHAAAVLALMLGLSGTAWAAPTLDGTCTVAQGVANVTLTITGHSTSGTDRLAIVVLTWEDDGTETVTSIVRNSQSFVTTALTPSISAGGFTSQAWRLIDPSTGAHDTVITMSAQANVQAAICSFTDVDQTTPIDGYGTDSDFTAVGNPPAVTSAAGDLVFDYFANAAATNPTVGAGQSSLLTITPNYRGVGASTEAGAASVTMSWTPATDNWWIWLGFNINDAAGAAPARRPCIIGSGIICE